MGAFHDVTTFHESTLLVQTATGTVGHGADWVRNEEWTKLTAFVPDERNICLLLPRASIAATLRVQDQEFGPSIPLRVLGGDAAGRHSFYDPTNGLYLCAAPLDASNGIGGISIDRRTIGEWERFALRELPGFSVAAEIALIGERFEHLLQLGSHAEALIRLLQREDAGPDWAPVIEALARLMPLEQLAVVAEWLIETPEATRRLATIYSTDFDATVTLPRLRDWLYSPERGDGSTGAERKKRANARVGSIGVVHGGEPDRQSAAKSGGGLWRWLTQPMRPRARAAIAQPAASHGSAQRLSADSLRADSSAAPAGSPAALEVLGPELDFLAQHGCFGEDVSFPHLCNVLLRQAVHPTQDACIVATARNEGLYLLEWIAYHRLIGVQSFFLYSNGNSDGSDELIAALHRSGVLVAIRNDMRPGTHVQGKSYGHAMGVLPDILDFRWVLVIDLDEFFTFDPDKFASIQDYVAWQEVQTVHAIALNWIVLTSGGEVRWRDQPMTRRFDKEIGGPALFIKTMSRVHRFIHSEPHFPIPHRQAPFIFRNSDRDAHEWTKLGTAALSDQPIANHAWINHYFFKSAEEFLCKWARGRTIDLVPRLTNEVLTADFVKQFMDQHIASSGLPPAKEARAIQRCAPDLDAEIERLMALPGVAAAQERIKDNYRAQIDGIVEMFATAPGIVEAGEAGQRFLRLFRPAPVATEAVP